MKCAVISVLLAVFWGHASARWLHQRSLGGYGVPQQPIELAKPPPPPPPGHGNGIGGPHGGSLAGGQHGGAAGGQYGGTGGGIHGGGLAGGAHGGAAGGAHGGAAGGAHGGAAGGAHGGAVGGQYSGPDGGKDGMAGGKDGMAGGKDGMAGGKDGMAGGVDGDGELPAPTLDPSVTVPLCEDVEIPKRKEGCDWVPERDERFCVTGYKCDDTAEKEALKKALEALKAKEEADKPCPFLDPYEHAEPHPASDRACDRLAQPGWSKQEGCECVFEVSERDDKGCALKYQTLCTRGAGPDGKTPAPCPPLNMRLPSPGCQMLLEDDENGCQVVREDCSEKPVVPPGGVGPGGVGPGGVGPGGVGPGGVGPGGVGPGGVVPGGGYGRRR